MEDRSNRDGLLRSAQLAATYADPRLVVQSSEILALLADLSKLEREHQGVAAVLVELVDRAKRADLNDGRARGLGLGMNGAQWKMEGRAQGLREALQLLERTLREAAAQSDGEEGQSANRD